MAKNSKKDRFVDAYKYLYENGKVHSVTELADKMGRSRPSVSRAMNGVEEYLNDKFLKSFTKCFPGVFNLDYLQNGEGELLANSKSKQPNENDAAPAALDMSFLFEKAIDKITASNDKTIASMEAQVAKLEETIKTKDKLIHILELRIRDLEFTINTMKLDADRDSYHGSMSNFASEPTMPKK